MTPEARSASASAAACAHWATDGARLKRQAKAGLPEKDWSPIEVEAVFGRVLCVVRRAGSWRCERWRWTATVIQLTEKSASARPIHAVARGFGASLESACRMAKTAAEAIHLEELKLERDMKRRRP